MTEVGGLKVRRKERGQRSKRRDGEETEGVMDRDETAEETDGQRVKYRGALKRIHL